MSDIVANEIQHDKLWWALNLAERGLRVFPLLSNSKAPPSFMTNYTERATRNPEQIRRWWGVDPQLGDTFQQDYNIGVVAGDDFALIDIDSPDPRVLTELVNRFGVPHTFVVQTPRLGWHLYLRTPHGVRNSVKQLGSQIDVRGSGGYLVGPGSIVDGKPYAIIHDFPIADAPPGLIDAIGRARDASPSRSKPILVDLDTADNIKAAQAYLARQERPEDGQRHNGKYRIAAGLIDRGLSPDIAAELMHKWNADLDDPMDDDNIDKICRDAWRYRKYPVGVAVDTAIDLATPIEIDESKAPPSVKAAQLRKEREMQQAPDGKFPQAHRLEDYDGASIPPRRWVVGNFLARGYVTALVSAPGVGKTSFMASLAVAIASGDSSISGLPIVERCNVWSWNQEDDLNELKRRFAAVVQGCDVRRPDGLYVDSGVDAPLVLAASGDHNTIKLSAHVDGLVERIRALNIGVLMLDPLAELHMCEENDNAAMRQVWGAIRRIAVECNCAVLVAAHSRKPPQASSDGFAGDMDSLRGASSQGGVIRLGATLYGMSEKDAERFNVGEQERNLYVRFDDGKNNIGLRGSEPIWFKRTGVDIGNGDNVGWLQPTSLAGRVAEAIGVQLVQLLNAAGWSPGTHRQAAVTTLMAEHGASPWFQKTRRWCEMALKGLSEGEEMVNDCETIQRIAGKGKNGSEIVWRRMRSNAKSVTSHSDEIDKLLI